MKRLAKTGSGMALTSLALCLWTANNPKNVISQDDLQPLEKIESNRNIVQCLRFEGATLLVSHDVVPFRPSLVEDLRGLSGNDRIRHEVLSLKETVGWDFETDIALKVGGEVLEPGVYRALPWILPTGGIEVVFLRGRKRWVVPARCHRLPVQSDYLTCSLIPKEPNGFRMNVQWGRDLAILGFER